MSGRHQPRRAASLSYVEIIPEVGFAAIKANDPGGYATYAVLRTWDREVNSGRGLMSRAEALSAVSTGRGVQRRQSERLLVEGNGRYWHLSLGDVRLAGLHRVAENLGVHSSSRARLVPAEQFQSGLAQVRAALMAAVYRVDDDGAPLARRKLAEITGVAVSTQRRYDVRFKSSTRVRSLSVCLGQPTISYVRGVVWANRHLGFFVGRQGALMRRHGNIRRANQLMGSRRASGRLNRKLKANNRPVDKARGQRPLRAYFGERHKGTKGWIRAKRALGKVPNSVTVHPLLNYSLARAKTKRGRSRWEVLRE